MVKNFKKFHKKSIKYFKMSNITDIDSESDSIISQDITPQINEPEDTSQTKKNSKSLRLYITNSNINRSIHILK